MEFSHGPFSPRPLSAHMHPQQWMKFWTNRTSNECSRGIINDRCGRQQRVQQWGMGGRKEKVVTSCCALDETPSLDWNAPENQTEKELNKLDGKWEKAKIWKQIKRKWFHSPDYNDLKRKKKLKSEKETSKLSTTINDSGASRGAWRSWRKKRRSRRGCVRRANNNHLSTSTTTTTTSMPDRCNHFGRLD